MADFRNKQEFLKAVREITDEFESRWSARGIGASLDELADLQASMEKPDFWNDQDLAKEISMKKADLEKRIAPWRDLRGELTDFPELVELTFEETADVKAALDSLAGDFQALDEKFEALLMAEALTGDDDHCNAIVTISSGAGGTESQDWTAMLMRMYLRWFENRGFSVSTWDLQDGEEAGIKSVTLQVRGHMASGYMRAENGIHRLVRISPFDSNKRRHTSFASVHVMPEIDDAIKVNIDKKDLREDTYRASGAGGQHVNKTDSAIRITHIPTGIVVQCQNERSQHKNRSTAMKMLEAKLYQLEQEKLTEDIESRSGEKKDVAWGSQIRSYVFHPYKMVKDLRTGYETSDVEGVMDGDLDGFINAYLKSLVPSKKEKVEK